MNMDSNVKRQGRDTCRPKCHWTSSPIRNRYRPMEAPTDGRLLENLATPLEAGMPPVRSDLKNREIDPTDGQPNRLSATEPNVASQRQSLASSTQIW